ncbi:transposase [Micromonospora sp. NPDC094482]|uniref:transposase n=1 Tax=unclassified Micromonospora TaxID=2617518 RepID=UPI00331DF493
MPAPYPPQFRQRAVELARLRDKPIREIAKDLGISESCLRNWLAQADTDEGKRKGLTSDERKELAALCKERRRLAVENEILRRAGGLLRWGRAGSGRRGNQRSRCAGARGLPVGRFSSFMISRRYVKTWDRASAAKGTRCVSPAAMSASRCQPTPSGRSRTHARRRPERRGRFVAAVVT